MVYKCCVPLCRGNYKTKQKVRFFKFPEDDELREKWVRAIRREDFKPSGRSVVCQLHFEDDEMVGIGKSGGVVCSPRLVEGAIPSRFPDYLEYLAYSQRILPLRLPQRKAQLDANCERPASPIFVPVQMESNDMYYDENYTDFEDSSPLEKESEFSMRDSSSDEGDENSLLNQEPVEPTSESSAYKENYSSCLSDEGDEKSLLKHEPVELTSECSAYKENYSSCLSDEGDEKSLLKHEPVELTSECSGVTSIDARKSFDLERQEVDNDVKPYQCTFCSFKCRKKDLFMQHSLIHTGEKQFKCSFCNYKSIRKGGLKRHMLTHTRNYPYKCNLCSYSCGLEKILKKHMVAHTQQNLFQCTFCTFKCERMDSFKRHLLIHEEEPTPYKCSLCNYRSQWKYNLSAHMKIHSGTKLKMHTGEKLLQCKYCSYRCREKQMLKTHLMIHSGEKPYSCQLCSYRSKYPCGLRIHMLKHLG